MDHKKGRGSKYLKNDPRGLWIYWMDWIPPYNDWWKITKKKLHLCILPRKATFLKDLRPSGVIKDSVRSTPSIGTSCSRDLCRISFIYHVNIWG